MKIVRGSEIARMLYPTVSVIVSARSKGRMSAMPAAWATPLSYTPPMVGVTIAPERYTYRLISESGYFAVNLLDFEYVDRVAYLGGVSGRYEPDKVAEAGFTVLEGKKAPVPVLAEAVGVIECRVKKRVEVGDHDLFAGESLIAYASEDFEEMWRLKSYSPIFILGWSTTAGHKQRGEVFVSLKGDVKDIPIAEGEAVEKRTSSNRAVRETAKKLGLDLGRPPTLNEISSNIRDLSIDKVDVELIAEQLRRQGRIRAVKAVKGST